MVKTSLVREIGLPKTEYFIWFDDTEYCMRFHRRSRILNVNTAVLNHKTAVPGQASLIGWKNYYGFRNAIDIGRTYSKCPPLYMAYITANHWGPISPSTLFCLLQEIRGSCAATASRSTEMYSGDAIRPRTGLLSVICPEVAPDSLPVNADLFKPDMRLLSV